jgi:hypothetical protein
MCVSVNWISFLALHCAMFHFSCIIIVLFLHICNIKRTNSSRNTLTLEQNLNKKIFLCAQYVSVHYFVCSICVCTLFLSTRRGAAMTVHVPQKSSIYTSTQKVKNRLHRNSQKQTAELRNPLSGPLLSEHYKSALCARLLTDFCVPSTGVILINLRQAMDRSSRKCSERVNFLDIEFHVMTAE